MKKSKFISTRIVASLLAITAAVNLTGCAASPKNNPDIVDTGIGEYRFAAYSEKLSSAQAEYELQVPGFLDGSYGEFEQLHKSKPRYYLYRDGIYHSESVDEDGIATIMLTGDLMCQGRQQEAGATEDNSFDFCDNFTYVADMFADADFVVGNLECTLSETASLMMEEPRVDGGIHCNAPSTYLDALRYAGFDLLMTANNHCLDTGLQGLFQTIAHLDQYGFLHTGTFLGEEDPRFVLTEIDGITVGFLSYTTKFNGNQVHLTEEGQEIFLNKYTSEKLIADVEAARNLGAEYIIAYNHWGTEYTNEQTNQQELWAQEMANAGVDYIVGSHPHALQPYDILTADDGSEVPIMYSLGNFVSHQEKTVSKETVVLQLELGRNEDGDVVLLSDGAIPCRTFKTFLGNNYTTVPLTEPYSDGHSSQYFAEAYDHITAVVGDQIEILGTLK